MRRPPLSDRRSSRLSLTAPICHHQQHRAAVDAQGAAHCAADKQQSAAGRPPRLASTSTAFAAPSLASGRRSEEPPGRRRCLPAAAIHRRRLGSIDCWHRAARWQVAGTLCFVPRRRRQAAFSDQRRAQPSSIEAGADPAASCKPLKSERVGEQLRSKLRHRGALRGAAVASSLLAGRRHSSAAAWIDRWLASGGAVASREDVALRPPPSSASSVEQPPSSSRSID